MGKISSVKPSRATPPYSVTQLFQFFGITGLYCHELLVTLMSSSRSIKIIKRSSRKSFSAVERFVHAGAKSENQTRREILKTVTSWIEELRESKKDLTWPKGV
jgi:hypothetical protein